MQRERERRKLRESDVRMCTISFSLFLPPEWWVVSFLSLSLSLSSFFSQSIANTYTKKSDEHAQIFFPSFRLMNSELLYSFSRARVRSLALL